MGTEEKETYVIHHVEQAVEQHPNSRDHLWIDLEEVDSFDPAPRYSLAVSSEMTDCLLYNSVLEEPIVRYTAEERWKVGLNLECSDYMADNFPLCSAHAVVLPEPRLISYQELVAD